MQVPLRWVVSIIASELLIVAVLIIHFAYANTILPGAAAAGVKLTGKTLEAATRLLYQSVSLPETVTLMVNNQEVRAETDKLILDLGVEEAVRQAYHAGRITKWNPRINLPIIVDEGYLTTLITQTDPHVIVPIEYPHIVYEDNELRVSPGKPGQGIDIADFTANLSQVLSNPTKPVPIKFVITAPPDPAELHELLAQARQLIETNIKLNFEDKQFEPDKTTVASWLVIKTSSAPVLYFNEEAIKKYVASVAKKVNRPAKPTEIDPDGIVVSEGKDGRKLDKDKAVDDIKLALSGGVTEITLTIITTSAGERHVAKPFTPGIYEGKYLEVNLANQTLYRFEGQNLIASHRVSTGKWSMPTPIGSFSINNKVGRAYSRRYNLYMPYWMSFIGGKYGIHELPEWPGGRKEGEAHLGTPVSHGCIRLGVGEAQQVYDWVEVGTPVVIHT